MNTSHLRPRTDLVLFGGRVHTLDPGARVAEAVAVAGDRIVTVDASADVRRLADGSTRLVDLRGRALVPGLVDAHAHMDREGLKALYPSLAGARTIDDVLQRIESLVDLKGSIEIGKLADIVVLSDDPLTCPEASIRDLTADLTIVGGRVVYERAPTQA